MTNELHSEVDGRTPVAERQPVRPRVVSGGLAQHVAQVLISLATLVAVWWAVAATVNPIFLPSPQRVGSAFSVLASDGTLAAAFVATLPGLFGGLFVACFLGAAGGLVMGIIPALDRIVGPWVYMAWSTPIVALLPVIMFVVGTGTVATILFVYLSSVFPVVMNARTGARDADPELIEVARSLGARRREILAGVIVPASIPHILAGCRVAVGRAVVAVIVAQLFLSPNGFGHLIRIYGDQMRLDYYFAALVMTVVTGVVLNGLADVGERHLLRWEETAS